jgi:L-arabonate dehydrase
LNNCNLGLREVADAVKKGVIAVGGLPLEFPTISLGEESTKPTAMLYRNLMAMDVEEVLRSNPVDGAVLLCNCDKTVPAQLMGAASANLPTIQVNGGPKSASHWRGVEVGSGTDFWLFWDDYRTNKISQRDLKELEECFGCGVGACNVMGTASTKAGLSEALGMMPWGTSTIGATDTRRLVVPEIAGRQIVDLVRADVRPSAILTEQAFENAIRVCMALGGSTNAVIHLIAIAGRLGIELTLEDFERIARTTLCITNVKPSGECLVTEFHLAGGVPGVMKELAAELHGECLTVNGKRMRENLEQTAEAGRAVIRTVEQPVRKAPTIAVLRGTLAPNGAILQVSAASPGLLRHTGRAVVFEDYQDMLERIDREDLDVTESSVLVLKNCGAKGAPGMPEWGALPIPAKLQKRGVKDMVRIIDSRMSGTAYERVVLHVSPEAAAGGPLSVVQTGDELSTVSYGACSTS